MVSTKTLSLLFAGLFLQQCHFLRQAGHSEKVISLFQAMVDFTFFKPDSVKELPTKVQVWHTLCLRSIPVTREDSLHDGSGVCWVEKGDLCSHIQSTLIGLLTTNAACLHSRDAILTDVSLCLSWLGCVATSPLPTIAA